MEDFFGNKLVELNKPIRLITLFSGYGSQEMAMRNIGADFEIWKAVEFDEKAMKSYNILHGTDFKPIDIRDVRGKDLGIIETDKYDYIMFYSFPCQSLSSAGQQKGMVEGSGTSSSLLWEVKRIMKELNESELPKVLIMENVPQVRAKKNIKEFDKWLSFLRSKGYKNFCQDLNAKDYGIPQNRIRCFCVSILSESEEYEFPKPIELKNHLKDILERHVDESYYIDNEKTRKLLLKNKNSEVSDKIIRMGTLECKGYGEGYRVMNPNGLSSVVKSEGGGYGILICEDPKVYSCAIRGRKVNGNYNQTLEIGDRSTANSITTCYEASMLVEGSDKPRIRKLTEKEKGRLMGVKDSDIERMKSVNTKSQIERQFGNSIVTSVLSAIFLQLGIQGKKRWNEMSEKEIEPLWNLIGK